MMSVFFVKSAEGNAIRVCPKMPMIGEKEEDKQRATANKKALDRFENMVVDGVAVEIESDLTMPLDCYDIIDGQLVELKSEVDRRRVEEVRQKRKREYPPIGDQLDAIMKWLSTESEFGIPSELKSISSKCMAVKSKYPIEGK